MNDKKKQKQNEVQDNNSLMKQQLNTNFTFTEGIKPYSMNKSIFGNHSKSLLD
ncbi:hypothetical protein pb186bvf_016133 [Paramecium bursaria]